MAVYVVTIAGATRALQPGWSINETANGRAVLTAAVKSIDASYRPAIGAEVILTEDGTRIFAGYIDEPAEQGIGGDGVTGIITSFHAADYNSLAERRSVIDGGFPAGWTLKQALTSLVGWLTDYGVTLHASQVDGPTLPLLVYDVRTVQSILDELSVITGYLWRIDFDKKLRMIAPGDLTAPVNITTASRYAEGDVTPVKSRTAYANYIILLAGTGTSEVTDDFVGDGSTTDFPLTYPLSSHRGYVTNGGVNETLDTSGATWIYDQPTNTISRTPAPANLNAISITYIAQFPLRVTADGGAAAADRVDLVIVAPETFSATVAQALADGYLDRAMAAETQTVKYRTRQTGLHPGQTQTITIAERNISGTFLITDETTVNAAGNVVFRDVTAVSGTQYPGSWRDAERQAGSSTGTTVGAVTVISSSGIGGVGTPGSLAQWATASTLGDATAVPASLLTGTILDARLSSNVPLKNAANTFTAQQAISSGASASLEVRANNNVALVSMKNQAGAESWTWRMPAGTDLVLRDTVNGVDHLTFTQGATASASFGGVLTATVVTTPVLNANANLAIQPGGDLVLDPVGNDVYPNTNYDVNLGLLTKKFLTLHAAELWVETLVAQNTIATIGGRILVGPTTTLTADLASGATTIQVKHNQMANGDRVYMEADGKVEFMAITSAPGGSAGAYTYSVTRNLDGSGANDWFAGDAVFNTGTTGDGFIDIYSTSGVISGSGPTIVGNVRVGTTYNQIHNRWAIGNLNGVSDYAADVYGAWFGDPNATNVSIDATNGIRIRSGTTNKLTADTSGNLNLVGDLIMGTAGVFRAGATAFGTTTGWWMDYNGGTPRFRIGNPAGNRISWDGTDLTLVSASVNINSSGISLSVPSTSLDALYGYSISSSYSGTNFCGVYAFEGSSTDRTLDLINSTTASGKTIRTVLLATNDSVSASLQLNASGSSIFIEVNALRPSANNAITCGDSTKRWSEVFAVNGVINTSDATLKSDLQDSDLGTAFLMALMPKCWRWTDGPDRRRHYGFTAQDVAAISPADFGGLARDPDGRPTGLNYSAFIAPLVSGFHDHEARLRALEQRVHG